MSGRAKLFITLCKQTVSWTACRRRGGSVCAREVREGCQRRCSLTPITLPLISPPWPPPHYSTHAASEAPASVRRAARERRPRPHVFAPPPLPPTPTRQVRGPEFSAEGADLRARARPPLGADFKAREGDAESRVRVEEGRG